MLDHPLIKALFNADLCEPSKQLIAVRKRLADSSSVPSIMLILPPADMLYADVDSELLFKDTFLLSHVLDVNTSQNNQLKTLNGADWMLNITKNEVIPDAGFPNQNNGGKAITNRVLWSPGYENLAFFATFMILEIDGLLLSSESLKKFSWFGMGKSTPKPDFNEYMNFRKAENSVCTDAQPEHDHVDAAARLEKAVSNHTLKLYSQKPLNPAKFLGRNASQIEQNMARVDYSLACLQGDVVSSAELAQRFHQAVGNVIKTVVKAGGLLVSEESIDDEQIDSNLGPNTFTTASIYRYAEYRLSKQVLGKLDSLLDSERTVVSFKDMHDKLHDLDIGQVDIPNVHDADVVALERAVAESAFVLGRLSQARNAYDMCQVFLQSLKTLADPRLGTVSADTLLGLFMLTVLRTSDDCAMVLERDLYFVMNFSFQTSENAAARASAGRLSYTLMVVQSVLMQLRMEFNRLSKLSRDNKTVWEAVKNNERSVLNQISKESPSSLVSRQSGKSVLFMAIENANSDLLLHLLKEFSHIYTNEFVFKDRDPYGRTLLMVGCKYDTSSAKIVLDYLSAGEVNCERVKKYFSAVDLVGRGVAFYMNKPGLCGDEYVPFIDFSSCDVHGVTPVIYHALKDNLEPFIPCISNFFDHMDLHENSLLHLASDDSALVTKLARMPSCDTNWTNRAGRSALQKAQNDGKCVDVLLQAGADPWLPFFLENKDTIAKMVHSVRDYPYVVRSSRDSERFEVYTMIDGDVIARRHSYRCFQELRDSLVEKYPTSWTPPLPSVRWGYSNTEEVFSMFSHILISQENIELSIWLKILSQHATFKDSGLLTGFLARNTTRSGGKQSDQPVSRIEKQEVIRPADKLSILAFFNLAQDYLSSIVETMSEIIRLMSRVEAGQLDAALQTTKIERRLSDAIAPRYRTEMTIKRCELTSHLHGSQRGRILRLSFGQLINSAQDFENRLKDPRRLSEELENEKAQYAINHEKLEELARARSKPMWLATLENKRLAEISSVEEAVTRGKSRISSLENLISSTHYSLASELSSFKKTHEQELLDQIRHYSSGKLQEAKDDLKRLEFGYKVKPQTN